MNRTEDDEEVSTEASEAPPSSTEATPNPNPATEAHHNNEEDGEEDHDYVELEEVLFRASGD